MHSAGTLGSINLGRWNGLPVRLHVSCLLVAVFVFFFRNLIDSDHLLADVGLIFLVWSVSVLLHELGHCLTVKRIGGTNDMLVLTPFGGLSFHSFPQQPGRDLWVAASGPLMNLLGFAIATGLLLALQENPWQTPFHPDGSFVSAPPLIVGLRLAIWINLAMFALNLLPTIPFDGSWMLHALLWPALGDRRAWMSVRKASIVSVCLLLLLATVGSEVSSGGIPLWLPLTVVAAYCFCFSSVPFSLPSAIHPDDDTETTSLPDDFSEEFEESEFHPIRSWQPQQRDASETLEEEKEHDEEYMVDAILQCVHDQGLASLTRAQHKILQRAARRYRSRTPK